MCLLSCARNHLGVVFFIFSFIRISNTLVSDSGSFTQSEECIFHSSNGKTVDLTPFKNYKPLTASTKTCLYIYHPCLDIPLNSVQNSECKESYGICYFVPQTPTDKPVDFNEALQNHTFGSFSVLAYNAEGNFLENIPDRPEIVYKHHKNGSTITTYVQLQCDENTENSTLFVVPTSAHEHLLTLSSRYICAKSPHYISGGTVFFIILLVLAILYFVGGILVLKFIRGTTGIEMIPNHEFWCNLPQMARNGFKYLSNCGKNTPDSYEKI